MRLTINLVILFVVLLLAACSGTGPVDPGIQGQNIVNTSNSGNRTRSIWGFWLVDVSADHQYVEATPLRTAGLHFNTVRFLEVAPCDSCLIIEHVIVSGPNELSVDVRLQHPFPGLLKFTGFDVRGIFISGSDYYFPVSGRYIARGNLLPRLNYAEGYTSLFNPTEFPEDSPEWPALKYFTGKYASGGDLTSTLNPYLAYRRNAERRMFDSTVAETRTYSLTVPEGGFHFGYAIDASWYPVDNVIDPLVDFPPEANCMEAYRIDTHVGPGIDDGPNGTSQVNVLVYDHQGSDTISSVVVESPELFSGVSELQYSTVIGENNWLYTGSIQNETGLDDVTVPLLVRVDDNQPDGNLGYVSAWDVSDINLRELLGWVKVFGDVNKDTLRRIAVDNSGNIIITGLFGGTVDFIDGIGEEVRTAEGLCDAFICKFTPDGDLIWVRTYGGPGDDRGHAVAIDSGDNIYVAGLFMHTVDFDPGTGFETRTSAGVFDPYVCKYSTDGQFQWVQAWGSSGDDRARGVGVDEDWNVYVTGHIRQTVDLDPGPGVMNYTSAGQTDNYISKFDTTGDFIWAKAWGGSSQEASNSIQVDIPGQCLYVTGQFSEWVDFDPGDGEEILVSNGGYDCFVSRFNLDGEFGWARGWGGPAEATTFGSDMTWCAAVDGVGDISVCGWYKEIVDFDPGPGTDMRTSVGSDDCFIVKFDPAGNYLWANTWGGPSSDKAMRIVAFESGDIVATGFFQGTVDLDPGPGSYVQTTSGATDLFITRFDPSGQMVWCLPVGGTGGDRGHGLAIDAEDFIYVGGWFEETVDFCPQTGIEYRASAGAQDIYLLKLTPEGTW